MDHGLLHEPGWLSERDRADLLAWLGTIHPLWEQRYPTNRPPPAGQAQRRLLRPVYWLGNWQFACLGYYEPPKIRDRAVQAEPFPPVIQRIAQAAEDRVHAKFPLAAIPRGWRLNTCLINFYGAPRVGNADAARVGEHRDVEPGPVASLSLGERALFQFIKPGRGDTPPVKSMWLGDGDLQAFCATWKDRLLHRVIRVEDKRGLDLPPQLEDFRTRRVNLTLRYVPDAHVVPLREMSTVARDDVREYVDELAQTSTWWASAQAG